MSTIRPIFAIVLCLVAGACSAPSGKAAADSNALSDEAFLKKLEADQKTSPSPAANVAPANVKAPIIAGPKITTATFEPVYRAAKAIQGATTSGVTYVKYGELLQTFSTELAIAKDHELNARDENLLSHFHDSYHAYHDSATVWAAKVAHGPVLSAQEAPEAVAILATYSAITPYAETGNYNADTAMQLIWAAAGSRLEEATSVYYGKPLATEQLAAERLAAERAIKVSALREQIALSEKVADSLLRAGKPPSTFLNDKLLREKQELKELLER